MDESSEERIINPKFERKERGLAEGFVWKGERLEREGGEGREIRERGIGKSHQGCKARRRTKQRRNFSSGNGQLFSGSGAHQLGKAILVYGLWVGPGLTRHLLGFYPFFGRGAEGKLIFPLLIWIVKK